MTQPAAAAPASAGSPFAHADFVHYLLARLMATLAVNMQIVAVGWQVYELTRDPLDLGLVGLAQFAPVLGLFLITGAAADRFERRRIVSLCYAVEFVCAILLTVFTLLRLESVNAIFVVLVLFGSARAFTIPAEQALVPNLVPRDVFPAAIAWSSMARHGATIVGPALGGLLLILDVAAVYIAVAALFALALVQFVFIRPRPPSGPRERTSLHTLLAGFRFVWSAKLILGAISIDLFAVLLGGATALLPIYAADILDVGRWGLGLLRAAPAVGALVCAVILARSPIRRHAGRKMFVAVGVFGIATVVFGISTEFWLSLAALVVLGAADMISVFIRQTLVQLNTPDAVRGRVTALNGLFIGASNELGEFESGVTADWFGVVPSVVIGGLGTLGVALVWTWLFPDLRRADTLLGEVRAPVQPARSTTSISG